MTDHLQTLPPADVERAFEFLGLAAELTPSKTALRIVKDIAEDTLRFGACHIPHAEFGRRTGKCRRTVDTALKRAIALGLIRRTGRTDEGRSIYAAVWSAIDGQA